MQVTSGATSDLQNATRLARHMVEQCGMSDLLGGPPAAGLTVQAALCSLLLAPKQYSCCSSPYLRYTAAAFFHANELPVRWRVRLQVETAEI